MADSLKLYIKTWCPWCIRAKQVLDACGHQYEELDVESNRAIYDEMIRISGQRLTPTLVVGDKVLPDFGPEELVAFLDKHGIVGGFRRGPFLEAEEVPRPAGKAPEEVVGNEQGGERDGGFLDPHR